MSNSNNHDSPTAFAEFALYGDRRGQAEVSFLHVEMISQRSAMHDFSIRPHVHRNLFQIVLVEHGVRRVTQDGVLSEDVKHAMIFTPPGVVHSFEVEQDPAGFVVTCSDDIIASLMVEADDIWIRDVFEHGRIMFFDPADESWQNACNILQLACQEEQRGDYQKRNVMQAAINIVLIIALRQALETYPKQREIGMDPSICDRLLVAIEHNFRNEHSVEAYASQLGVSPVRLNLECKTRRGMSVKQLITNRIIQEAKRLLIYSSRPVSELAYELGFNDHAYFSRVFRNQTGQSPKTFREAHRDTVNE